MYDRRLYELAEASGRIWIIGRRHIAEGAKAKCGPAINDMGMITSPIMPMTMWMPVSPMSMCVIASVVVFAPILSLITAFSIIISNAKVPLG